MGPYTAIVYRNNGDSTFTDIGESLTGVWYSDADIRFFSSFGDPPNWSDSREKRLAVHIRGGGAPDLYMMFNAWSEAAEFTLPAPPAGRKWHLAADTQRPSPDDICESGEETLLDDQAKYEVGPRSSVILVGWTTKRKHHDRHIQSL